MPRKIPCLPHSIVKFERYRRFTLDDFRMPTFFEVMSYSNRNILNMFRERNLVHKFCPEKSVIMLNSNLRAIHQIRMVNHLK